jgi:hypothetical protein
MIFFPPATPLNDNHRNNSVARQNTFDGVKPHQVPSDPVLSVIRTALQCLGPLGPSDAIVLSRMLKRLFEVENHDGVVVAIEKAKELAKVLQLQKCARAHRKASKAIERH